MENLKQSLEKIKNQIVNAEQNYKRCLKSVTLVAVSKSQPSEKIRHAFLLGQTHFGENYLQEARLKIKELSSYPITWHYIGKIQTNKTKAIATNFTWVETVTSYEIAELLNKYRPTNLPPLEICLQVNLDNSKNKNGIVVDEILPLAKKIILLPRLKLRGLMTIPTYHKQFEQQLKIFSLLASELKKLQQHQILVDTLSMGMSNDFEAAIAAGATMIRIGTAIFGTRPQNPSKTSTIPDIT